MTNTDLMNVTAFEDQLPDAAFAGLNPESESLADGIGQSYGILGYKGKVWTLRYRGETYTFTRPDDGTPSAFLDGIVLRSASYRSKSWYEGGYQEGITGVRPTCASLDGVVPDGDVVKKQAEACAICPRNEFKQNANGKKGKDCSDYKRLAFLILPSQSARLFNGQPLMEPVFLRVPAASLNDLAMLGEAMSKKGFHYATYITRIGFDMEKPHPQMVFRALQKLTDKEAPIVLQLREDPQSYRITGENEVGKPKPSANSAGNGGLTGSVNTGLASTTSGASTTTAQTVQQKPAQSGTQQASTISHSEGAPDELAELRAKLAAAEAKAAAATGQKSANNSTTANLQSASTTVDTGFGAVGGSVVNGEVIAPARKPTETVDMGFGMINQTMVEVAPNSSGQTGTLPTTNTVEDTGPAEESDEDLDARVAGLLQR
jgi:hypothetical protein